MKFFGFITTILVIVASILIVPVFTEYFATGLVPRFPTLFVACSMTVIAVQSFFAGLILSAIEQRDRQEFEFRLNDVARKKDKMREGAIH